MLVGSSAKCCPRLSAEYSRKLVHQLIQYNIIREGTPQTRVIGIILAGKIILSHKGGRRTKRPDGNAASVEQVTILQNLSKIQATE